MMGITKLSLYFLMVDVDGTESLKTALGEIFDLELQGDKSGILR
jgi:hypothetical protein